VEQIDDISVFRVTGHYFFGAEYGDILVGMIERGGIAPGMIVETGTRPSTLVIRGVESHSNSEKRLHGNGLIFEEKPTVEFLEQAFPVGSRIAAANV
jgi:hypothetical protein